MKLQNNVDPTSPNYSRYNKTHLTETTPRCLVETLRATSICMAPLARSPKLFTIILQPCLPCQSRPRLKAPEQAGRPSQSCQFEFRRAASEEQRPHNQWFLRLLPFPLIGPACACIPVLSGCRYKTERCRITQHTEGARDRPPVCRLCCCPNESLTPGPVPFCIVASSSSSLSS